MEGSTRHPNDYGGEAKMMGRPVDRAEHALTLYEKRIDALMSLVGRADNPVTVDAHRRAQEQLSQEAYDTLPYYDRWLITLRDNLVEAGILDAAEIDARIARLAAAHEREEQNG